MSTYQEPSNERDVLLAALQEQTDLLNAHPEDADIITKAMKGIEEIDELLAALELDEAHDPQPCLSPILETLTIPQLQTDGPSCPPTTGGYVDDSDTDTDASGSDGDEDELNDHLHERFCNHECDHESCRLANEHWYGCESQVQSDCDSEDA